MNEPASGTLRASFAIPGDIDAPTGGYEYDRRLIAAAPEAGLELSHLPLPGGFPTPSRDEAAAARATLAAALAMSRRPILADGLALGALEPERWPDGLGERLVILCHHPLGLETGLLPDQARAMLETEGRALRAARSVLTTSRATAATLAAELGVDPARIRVAEPGLDPAPRAPRLGDPPLLLGVGTLSARKDWPTLAAALAMLKDRDWRCLIAGDATRDPEAAARLERLLIDEGLDDRVALPGALRRVQIERLYEEADLFCLPSRHEGYGMVVIEAMARGLPVLASDAGAIPEAADGAALLLPPGDPAAWAEAIAGLLDDRQARDRMAEASLARAARAATWGDAARIAAEALAGAAGAGAGTR
ncbi:glycosyltransferase family 4 protein [Albimonas pacifica]|uniref:Glycosyltransferase involved in cell wall bisynthesis n=1 Tax=Albimonas pacifica TaxID=1114924 RepID=A0A1I3H2I1_9RHOB|nr:glycosyltransferase family 4 protein [Albimonas pacifica]SFI29780.1 Glycosyltransferase involved in cell wall bisynthesis [Albimonas pacifica]